MAGLMHGLRIGALEQASFVSLELGTKKNPSYGMKRSGRVRVQAAAGTEGPDLSVIVNGLKLPNPFVIASGPPGTNYTVMKRAFDEGWGAVIAKTVQFPQTFLFLYALKSFHFTMFGFQHQMSKWFFYGQQHHGNLVSSSASSGLFLQLSALSIQCFVALDLSS
jgi:hypothetical protein